MSLAGLLSIKGSAKFSAKNLPYCVDEIVKSFDARFPEIRSIDFVYVNTNLRSYGDGKIGEVEFKDMTLYDMLKSASSFFGHVVCLDIKSESIKFVVPSLGEEKRTFVLPDSLAKKMGIATVESGEFTQSIERLGFLGNVTVVDRGRRVFLATGSENDISYLENVIMAGWLIPPEVSFKIAPSNK